MLLVSYSGVRGIYGDSLTGEVARRFGRAFGEMLSARYPGATLLLARDTRASGPALRAALLEGLAGFGFRLIDLGVAPTPTLQLSIGALGAQAGAVITASHNPARWNGFKFFLGPDNLVLDAAQTRELLALVGERGDIPAAAPPAVEEAHEEALRLHVERVLGAVDVPRIAARGFRVALDPGGGAGAEPALELLRRLGCEPVVVSAARESEPLPEHLSALCQAVVAERCDLGFAQDLDADRLALVDERGRAPGEEYTLALALEHLLGGAPRGAVVVKNVSTTRVVDDLAARYGARLVETPVGEIHLSRALLEASRRGEAAFGGEGNGGVILPAVTPGRDSLTGMALILEALSASPEPLSARLAALPRYAARKAKVEAKGLALEPLFARAIAAFPEARPSRLDGLKLTLPDGSWLGIRPSNTEPILRLSAESASPAWADAALERLLALLEP